MHRQYIPSLRQYPHLYSLGRVLATDKVVNDVGVTDALLDGLGVAQVVFLCGVRTI